MMYKVSDGQYCEGGAQVKSQFTWLSVNEPGTSVGSENGIQFDRGIKYIYQPKHTMHFI